MLVMHCSAHAAASPAGDIVATKSPEVYKEVPLGNLRLDRQNPRLRGDREWKSTSDEDLLAEFARSYRLIEIARSIADKGFTPRQAEALLVVKDPNDKDHYVVIEGNRRLATLKLLTSESARHKIGLAQEWDSLAADVVSFGLDASVPVIIYANREALNAYLGFRHITGPRPWRPEAKARFIGKLLRDGESIDSVVRRIGSNHRTVRRFAEAHAIFMQAHDANLETDEIEKGFGIFYNALDWPDIRRCLGLGPQIEINELPTSPVTPDHLNDLKDLISFLFGDKEKNQSRVISESRELRKLNDVLADEKARSNLIQNRNLDLAWRISGGGKQEVIGILSGIYPQLAEINGKAVEFRDDEDVREQVLRIYKLVADDMADRYGVK